MPVTPWEMGTFLLDGGLTGVPEENVENDSSGDDSNEDQLK